MTTLHEVETEIMRELRAHKNEYIPLDTLRVWIMPTVGPVNIRYMKKAVRNLRRRGVWIASKRQTKDGKPHGVRFVTRAKDIKDTIDRMERIALGDLETVKLMKLLHHNPQQGRL